MKTPCIGRFAPSPTGPLHLGSLYTALASYLDARKNQGQWLLRIEDLDPPREQPGASDDIITCLKAHALHWDGDIIYQSRRHQRYQQIIDELLKRKLSYYCDCSRKQLKPYGEDYPGFCRDKHVSHELPSAIRLRTERPTPTFTDRLLGQQQIDDSEHDGYNDFIIKRKDNLYAYQLAVVIDDIDQGVTDIVRGSDILDSTFKQIYLYRYLQQPLPNYLHLPVINNAEGQKLSKQNLARAIDHHTPIDNLLLCLRLLNQPLPPAEYRTDCSKILKWAAEQWDISRLSPQLAISSSPTAVIN